MEFPHKERTVLPSTCGEETDLPGVPAVGCVATVHYRPGSVHSVAAVITSSCDAVHVLGPDLEQRSGRYHEHCLFTRTVWFIPAQQQGSPRSSHNTDTGLPAATGSAVERRHGHDASALTEEPSSSGATITSLVAFLAQPPAAGGSFSAARRVRSSADPRNTAAPDDTVCVCVSWIDARGDHHVSALFFSLLAALTRSQSGPTALRLRVHLHALQPQQCATEGRRGAILRLFYHPSFARPADTAAHTDDPLWSDGASLEAVSHVVLCSCYQIGGGPLPAADQTTSGEHASPVFSPDIREATLSGVVGAAGNAATTTTTTAAATAPPLANGVAASTAPEVRAMSRARVRAPPAAVSSLPGRRGWLAFLKIRWHPAGLKAESAFTQQQQQLSRSPLDTVRGGSLLDDKSAKESGEEGSRISSQLATILETAKNDNNHMSATALSEVMDAAETDVAPWLWRFQTTRVVVSFSVQSVPAPVIAAAGTADGRILLLYEHSDQVVRRLVGPISDIGFVDTQPSHGDRSAKSKAIDELLQKRMDRSPLETTRNDAQSGSLVALDAAGNVVVLHGINSAAPKSQMVADIPQLITLTDTRAAVSVSFVDAPAPPAPEPAAEKEVNPVNAKSFLDLSTLRKFFSTRSAAGDDPPSAPHPPAGAAAASVGNQTVPEGQPLGVPQLSATPLKPAEATPNEAGQVSAAEHSSAREQEEFHLSGHLLSRGLVYGTWTASTSGGPELIVSTLGQAVVSIPYDPGERNFVIAGFTMTPTPMNYIAFIDFFNTGVPELVMTSPHSVLVARSSRDVLRERIALLTRVLQARASPTTASGGGDAQQQQSSVYADAFET